MVFRFLWQRPLLGLLGVVALTSCSGQRETPQSKAKPGDLLVQADGQRVELVEPFRAAIPNSLLDGVVRIRGGGRVALMEVNVVCSMPSLPGWPAYDNLYGRPIAAAAEARGASGRTSWQALFHFSGKVEMAMGAMPGRWANRLRDNLCRRGAFDDSRS